MATVKTNPPTRTTPAAAQPPLLEKEGKKSSIPALQPPARHALIISAAHIKQKTPPKRGFSIAGRRVTGGNLAGFLLFVTFHAAWTA
jgi:hypothetical protein